MSTGSFFVMFLFVVVVFLTYKAIYDIFILSRRDLVRQLKEQAYTDIEVSKPEYEDKGNYFPEKPFGLLNYGKVPICYVHFFKVKYKDNNGKECGAVARVESRYLKRADILIRAIH